jgi:gamma-glutamylputrescine oxidase
MSRLISSPLAKARSWYQDNAPPPTRFPPLVGDQYGDVVIVGGGYTGRAAALTLGEAGYEVVLLEADQLGNGASGRNGGQVATGYNKNYATLAARYGTGEARAMKDIADAGLRWLKDRVVRHQIDCNLRMGYLHVAEKARHMRELREIHAEATDWGDPEPLLIEHADIGDWVASGRYEGGMLDSASGQLHPYRYVQGLAAAAAALPTVRLYENTPVTAIDTGAKPSATTAHGTVHAKHMIIAGNAFATLDGRMTCKIMPVGTYIVGTQPMDPARADALIKDRVAVCDLNFVLNYYRISPDHRMLFGGRVSYTGRDEPGLRPRIRSVMLRYFPQLSDLKIEYCWGGYVAITMNRLPHLGRLGPSTLFAQGYSGQGVILAGMAGALMAEAVKGQAERFDVLTRIRHDTFPGGDLLRTPALVLAMLYYRLKDWV